jgi:hypothetical protein
VLHCQVDVIIVRELGKGWESVPVVLSFVRVADQFLSLYIELSQGSLLIYRSYLNTPPQADHGLALQFGVIQVH